MKNFPREAVDSPSLEISKTQLDMVLVNLLNEESLETSWDTSYTQLLLTQYTEDVEERRQQW